MPQTVLVDQSLQKVKWILTKDQNINIQVNQKKKMKILQSTQRNFSILGIGVQQSNGKYILNVRNGLALFVLGLASISCYVQLFHVANNFQEYTDAVYMSVSTTGAAAELVIAIWKMRPLFECVTSFEKIVNTSEFRFEAPFEIRSPT